MEKRIDELEIRYTYQEQKLELMSETLYAQQRTLDRLVNRLEALERRMAELLRLVDPGATNEEPPHY
jgi:SlyX protein